MAWPEFLFCNGTDKSYVGGGIVLNAIGQILCADVSWQNTWTEGVSVNRGSWASLLSRDLMYGDEQRFSA